MNFKKIIFALLITLTLIQPVFAQVKRPPVPEDILPKSSVNQLGSTSSAPVLPTKDFKDEIIPQAVNFFLGMVATISFGMFLYAGINLVIAQGNEEEMTKFKNMMVWAIVGLVLITLSFAIVKGVLQIQFLN